MSRLNGQSIAVAWLALAFILSGFTRATAAAAVEFPTGDAAWTVDITYTDAPGAKIVTKKPQKIEVTQVNNVTRIHATWSDGTTSDRWRIPKFPVTFREYPDGQVFSVPDGHNQDGMDRASMPSDASAFDWITPQDLKEPDPVSHLQKQCYHYVGSVSFTLAINAPKMPPAKREAWIDSKTLFPVELDTDSAQYVFTFSDKPPTGPLTMPPKFQKEVNYYKAVNGIL